jgi:hypothetical protein
VLFPEINTSLVFVELKGNSTSTKFLSKSITHHGDGLHGSLVVNILRFNTDDSVVIVDVFVGVGQSLGLVLKLNLFLTV